MCVKLSKIKSLIDKEGTTLVIKCITHLSGSLNHLAVKVQKDVGISDQVKKDTLKAISSLKQAIDTTGNAIIAYFEDKLNS